MKTKKQLIRELDEIEKRRNELIKEALFMVLMPKNLREKHRGRA